MLTPCFLATRYAKFVDLEKNVLTTEEDELIQKVLTNRSTKRKLSIDNEDSNESTSAMATTEGQPPLVDENDLKWAANYIEEQQTQLILSLLDDNGNKVANNEDDDEDDERHNEEEYKSLRPSLETMGIGK